MSEPPDSPTRPGSRTSTRPGRRSGDFLRSYAERLNSVELNTTGYRLPAEEQFRRWAEATPAGFRFAVKMAAPEPASPHFTERVRALGDRLGPVRIVVQQARDDAFLARLLDSLDPELDWALDFRHESWAGAETGRAAVVNAVEGDASFRYLRLREPPYDEAALARLGGADAPARSPAGSRSTRTSSTRTSRRRPRTRRGCSNSSPPDASD